VWLGAGLTEGIWKVMLVNSAMWLIYYRLCVAAHALPVSVISKVHVQVLLRS